MRTCQPHSTRERCHQREPLSDEPPRASLHVRGAQPPGRGSGACCHNRAGSPPQLRALPMSATTPGFARQRGGDARKSVGFRASSEGGAGPGGTGHARSRACWCVSVTAPVLLSAPDHCRMVSTSDVFTPVGRTTVRVVWDLSVQSIDDQAANTSTRQREPPTSSLPYSSSTTSLRPGRGCGAGGPPPPTTRIRRRCTPRASNGERPRQATTEAVLHYPGERPRPPPRTPPSRTRYFATGGRERRLPAPPSGMTRMAPRVRTTRHEHDPRT